MNPDSQYAYEQSLLRRTENGSGLALMFMPKSTYPLPISLAYKEQTRASLQTQQARLEAEHDLRPVVGIELEFATYKEPADDADVRWKAYRDRYMQETEDPALREAIAEYGPRETMMHYLLHEDPRTKDLLEPLAPNQYFDGGDMMEVKFRTTASEQVDALDTVATAVYEAAVDRFGLPFYERASAVGFQPNISYEDLGGNVLDDTHPRFETLAPVIAAGMLRATYDAFPMQLGNPDLRKATDGTVALTVDRMQKIRYAKGRLETRPSNDVQDFSDPGLLSAVAHSGAQFGLDHADEIRAGELSGVVAPVRWVEKFAIAEQHGPLKVVRHVLNGALIEDGRLVVPQDYVEMKATRIGEELGITDGVPYELAMASQALGGRPDYTDGLQSFFGSVHVRGSADQGYTIEWPTTAEGEFTFTDRNGTSHRIAVDELSSHLGTGTGHPILVSDGYDVGAGREGSDGMVEARRARLTDSPALDGLDPYVRAAMVDNFDARAEFVDRVIIEQFGRGPYGDEYMEKQFGIHQGRASEVVGPVSPPIIEHQSTKQPTVIEQRASLEELIGDLDQTMIAQPPIDLVSIRRMLGLEDLPTAPDLGHPETATPEVRETPTPTGEVPESPTETARATVRRPASRTSSVGPLTPSARSGSENLDAPSLLGTPGEPELNTSTAHQPTEGLDEVSDQTPIPDQKEQNPTLETGL